MSAISSCTFVSFTELLFFQSESLLSMHKLPLLHVLLYSLIVEKTNPNAFNLIYWNYNRKGRARRPEFFCKYGYKGTILFDK